MNSKQKKLLGDSTNQLHYLNQVLDGLHEGNIVEIANKVREIEFTNEEQLENLVELFFRYAYTKPQKVEAYASVCEEIRDLKVTILKIEKDIEYGKLRFIVLLENRIKMMYDHTISICLGYELLIPYLQEKEMKEILKLVKNHVIFIGELYKRDLIPTQLMFGFINRIAKAIHVADYFVDLLLAVLELTANALESRDISMGGYFRILKGIVNENSVPTDLLERCKRLLRMRASKWVWEDVEEVPPGEIQELCFKDEDKEEDLQIVKDLIEDATELRECKICFQSFESLGRAIHFVSKKHTNKLQIVLRDLFDGRLISGLKQSCRFCQENDLKPPNEHFRTLTHKINSMTYCFICQMKFTSAFYLSMHLKSYSHRIELLKIYDSILKTKDVLEIQGREYRYLFYDPSDNDPKITDLGKYDRSSRDEDLFSGNLYKYFRLLIEEPEEDNHDLHVAVLEQMSKFLYVTVFFKKVSVFNTLQLFKFFDNEMADVQAALRLKKNKPEAFKKKKAEDVPTEIILATLLREKYVEFIEIAKERLVQVKKIRLEFDDSIDFSKPLTQTMVEKPGILDHLEDEIAFILRKFGIETKQVSKKGPVDSDLSKHIGVDIGDYAGASKETIEGKVNSPMSSQENQSKIPQIASNVENPCPKENVQHEDETIHDIIIHIGEKTVDVNNPDSVKEVKKNVIEVDKPPEQNLIYKEDRNDSGISKHIDVDIGDNAGASKETIEEKNISPMSSQENQPKIPQSARHVENPCLKENVQHEDETIHDIIIHIGEKTVDVNNPDSVKAVKKNVIEADKPPEQNLINKGDRNEKPKYPSVKKTKIANVKTNVVTNQNPDNKEDDNRTAQKVFNLKNKNIVLEIDPLGISLPEGIYHQVYIPDEEFTDDIVLISGPLPTSNKNTSQINRNKSADATKPSQNLAGPSKNERVENKSAPRSKGRKTRRGRKLKGRNDDANTTEDKRASHPNEGKGVCDTSSNEGALECTGNAAKQQKESEETISDNISQGGSGLDNIVSTTPQEKEGQDNTNDKIPSQEGTDARQNRADETVSHVSASGEGGLDCSVKVSAQQKEGPEISNDNISSAKGNLEGTENATDKRNENKDSGNNAGENCGPVLKLRPGRPGTQRELRCTLFTLLRRQTEARLAKSGDTTSRRSRELRNRLITLTRDIYLSDEIPFHVMIEIFSKYNKVLIRTIHREVNDKTDKKPS